ncbi:MAG: rhodanese-like domain-containing protein [Planctomycetota bacterium]|nr:rhodanese-like domain-containing protein [Planctomycetota bacterium]
MLKRRAFSFLIVALAIFMASGCGSSVSDKSLKYVNPNEAITLQAGRDKLLGLGGSSQGVYIDPRTKIAFQGGHIEGAINLSFNQIRHEMPRLREYGVLIVYGDNYNDPLAIAMSKRLIEVGLKNVHTLRGGLQAWKAAGNVVTIGE